MTTSPTEFPEPVADPLAVAAGNRQDGASARDVARVLFRRPLALGGLVWIGLMVVLALFGTLIAPSGENDVDVPHMLKGPSALHWFGTDELGRDVLSRVIIAAQPSLEVSVRQRRVRTRRGRAARPARRVLRAVRRLVHHALMDILFAFPVMLLAIAIVAVLGAGIGNAMIAIAVVYTPIFARMTRASVLSVREEVYVRAAVSIGVPDRGSSAGTSCRTWPAPSSCKPRCRSASPS